MEKKISVFFLLTILGFPCFSESFFTYYQGKQHLIGISIVPLGTYSYVATQSNGYKNYFDGGFWEIGLSYEYRLFENLGFEAYGDFKGHKYDGYVDSGHPLVEVWGLPGFKIGAGGVYHFFTKPDASDLSLSFGIEYAHYIVDEVNSFPGFGMSTRLRYTWRLLPVLGLGLLGAVHYSTHPGGPYVDDPGTSRLPFELAELGIGIQVYVCL